VRIKEKVRIGYTTAEGPAPVRPYPPRPEHIGGQPSRVIPPLPPGRSERDARAPDARVPNLLPVQF
jgi:hypothetical protein